MVVIWQTRYQLLFATFALAGVMAATQHAPPVIRAIGFLLVIAAVVGLMYQGREYTGTVVNVSDGDTLTLLTRGNKIVVRLAGIDAPERLQPHGLRAAKALEDYVWRQTVRVVRVDQDQYGRMVGVVYTRRDCLNVWMIQQGHAWYYPEYSRFLSRMGKLRWQAAEQQAKRLRRGLWGQNNPVRPALWRKQQR